MGHERDQEWLLVLQPHTSGLPIESAADDTCDASGPADPCGNRSLRVALDQFRALLDDRAVTVVDVRGSVAFASGHIPRALMIPLASLEAAAAQLRHLGKPIVTYTDIAC
jgi:3-mercaptopyruvate sulfurtransferase SseA